jgi:hypothetical protein
MCGSTQGAHQDVGRSQSTSRISPKLLKDATPHDTLCCIEPQKLGADLASCIEWLDDSPVQPEVFRHVCSQNSVMA